MNMALCDRPSEVTNSSDPKRRTVDPKDSVLSVRMWGVRGSISVSGSQFTTYGGNTTCLEVRCGENILIFDAGSGLVPAGLSLLAEGAAKIDLFLSHSHYDHIIGLPYFKPLFNPEAVVKIHSGHMSGEMTTREIVDEFMRPPYFPVRPSTCRANLRYGDFKAGEVLSPQTDVVLKTGMLNHPGGAIGYRLEWAGHTLAIITDTEHVPGELDPAVLALIEGADLFLYDACNTDAEMEKFKGWGHSSWQQAIRLASAANVKSVGFMHHAPWRTDQDLDEIDRLGKLEFANSFAAREGQIISLRHRLGQQNGSI